MNRIEPVPDGAALARRRNFKRNTAPAVAMAGPVTFWMLFFVLIPLMYVVVISFMARDAYGGITFTFTLANYTSMLEPVYLNVIWQSIKLAFFTTAICLLIGYPLAYYIARKPSKTAAKLLMLIMIPFWTNSLVRLYSIGLIAAPNGFINNVLLKLGIISEPLQMLHTNGIVVVGLLISMLPFAVLPLYASIEKLDKAYLEASSDLGAKPRGHILACYRSADISRDLREHHSGIHSVFGNVLCPGNAGRRKDHADRKSDQKPVPCHKELAVRRVALHIAGIDHASHAVDVYPRRQT